MAQETQSSSIWLSTYGLVTVERVLGHYQIRLQPDDLIRSLQNNDTFFFQLVQLPLMNVMTGLIRQQAYDLQVYAQKLFVDYLLSGETVKPDSSPGGLTREELETTRLELVTKSKEFHELEYVHDKQIARCQREIVAQIKSWRKQLKKTTQEIYALARKAQVDWTADQTESLIIQLLANLPVATLDAQPQQVFAYLQTDENREAMQQISEQFCQALSPLQQQSEQLIENTKTLQPEAQTVQDQIRQYRKSFETIIIQTKDLLRGLPDYQLDQDQDEANRSLIQLDQQVTENN